MSRPPLEVADLIRSAGPAFLERNRSWIGWKHLKVLLAIVRCRTASIDQRKPKTPLRILNDRRVELRDGLGFNPAAVLLYSQSRCVEPPYSSSFLLRVR